MPAISARPQVNIDVLSWLLRPVPFVAGLPASLPPPPTPTPFAAKNDDDDDDDCGNKSNNNKVPAARDRETTDGVVVPGGGVSDTSRAEEVARTKTKQAGKGFPGCGAVGESPPVLGLAAVEERRAVPVPMPNFQGAGGSGAGEETKEGSKNRAGFHSYDETHQVIKVLGVETTTLPGQAYYFKWDNFIIVIDVHVPCLTQQAARAICLLFFFFRKL